MKVCSKCNAKIKFKALLKSTYNKRDGLIECDKCSTIKKYGIFSA